MKKSASILLTLLLVSAILVSCGGGGAVVGGGEGEGGSNLPDVSDNSQPQEDPVPGSAVGGVSPSGVNFLTQTDAFLSNSALGDLISLMPSWKDIAAQDRSDVAVYGLYAWTGEYPLIFDDMMDIGFANIRATGYMENSNGTAVISDSQMELYCTSGISVMVTMGKSISSTGYGYACVKGDDYQNLNNYDVATWVLYNVNETLTMLAKYGPDGTFFDEHPDLPYNPISYVEIFNEPNFGYLLTWPGHTANEAIKAKLYTILQTVTYFAVHEKYGDGVKIVGGSLGGEGSELHFLNTLLGLTKDQGSIDFLNNLIAENDEIRELMGLEEDFEPLGMDFLGTLDVLSCHLYFNESSPFAQSTASYSIIRQLSAMREAMEKNKVGGSKIPIWITECGWQVKGRTNVKEDMESSNPTYKWGDYVYNANDWGWVKYGNVRTGTDQMTQAAMSVQYYLLAMRTGVERITYMHAFDTDGCNYGLFNYLSSGAGDMSWRKVCYAIQVMSTLMPNPKLVNVIHEGTVNGNGMTDSTDHYYIYEFESDVGGEIVTVVFSPLNPVTVNVKWDADYALVTDMLGVTKIVAATEGKIVLEAGPCPMYVRPVSDSVLIENGILPNPSVSESALTALVAWVENKED